MKFHTSVNDTGLNENTVFTGEPYFAVKEIAAFALVD
jgi:hypothetical protein